MIEAAFDTKWIIRAWTALMFAVVILAIAGVGRAFDVLHDAWEPLVTMFGLMVGGQTWKRTQELRQNVELQKTQIAAQAVATGGPA